MLDENTQVSATKVIVQSGPGSSMLRLFLLRHAKSAWPDGVSDFDRPLAPRGEQAAPLMAAYMARQGYRPQLALVSTAKRTRETLALVTRSIEIPEVRFCKEIYGADPADLLTLVHELGEEVTSLLIIGHNPAMEALSEGLVNLDKSNPAAMQHLALKYPTAGLAVFDFPLSGWRQVRPHLGNLRQFITPRMLGGVDED